MDEWREKEEEEKLVEKKLDEEWNLFQSGF